MAYAWIITKNCLENEKMFVAGPGDNPDSAKVDAWIAELENGGGEAFKIYDDDDVLNMTGRFIEDGENGEDCFGPLDDYGMPSWGCTGIKYRNKATGKWEYV